MAMSRTLPKVVQTSSYEEIDQLQSDAIRALARRTGRRLSILEAGCGQRWNLDLAGVDFTLTGVDLDPAALAMRKDIMRDLDVAFVGDLCSVRLPEASFDVVYSAFVLEHVQRADLALENLVRWLRPGGLLILRLPDRRAARTFLARALPHRVHVWYYRYVLGKREAGQPGHAPYPTYHHPATDREHLYRFFCEEGVTCLNTYGDGFIREGRGRLAKLLIRVIFKTVSALSLGALTAEYRDVLYIAEKHDSGTHPKILGTEHAEKVCITLSQEPTGFSAERVACALKPPGN
jgi:SAM-dependent methyltransferase